MRAEDPILGDEIFILQEQSLVDEARYIRQQPRPSVVAHGEATSYAAAGGPVLRIFWTYALRLALSALQVLAAAVSEPSDLLLDLGRSAV